MTKNYLPHRREIRQIATYREALRALVDASLMGHEIKARYNSRWSRRNMKSVTPICVALYTDKKLIWRAANSVGHDSKPIMADEARLVLRDYLHTKDGVSLEALDYAEQIDE